MLKRPFLLALVLGTLSLASCSKEDAPAPKPAPTASGSQNSAGLAILYPGEVLYENQGLRSNDGRFTLMMQSDGNLVIYQAGVGAIWSIPLILYPHDQWMTHFNSRLTMQNDGNLVINCNLLIQNYPGSPWYNAGIPMPTFVSYINVWYTATPGHPGAYLVMQDDGNLVVYQNGQALWNSGTSGR